jgi:hypothetical protein
MMGVDRRMIFVLWIMFEWTLKRKGAGVDSIRLVVR